MNINNVFVCDIYKCNICDLNENVDRNCNCDKSDGFIINYSHIIRMISFAKCALVYYSFYYNCFIDMETNERYSLKSIDSAYDGELFVDFDKDKIYGKELMNSKRNHFTKKKILKKYNEFKGDNNEC